MANVPPIRVLWYAPDPIFVARVNMPGGITYPIADIAWDGATVGAYTDVRADMLVTFGSAEGLDDLGRTRTRSAPTSTVLKIGRSSQGYEDGQVAIADNIWIHIYPDFRVWSKIPVISGDYNEYKDTDVAVGDLTEEPPPIVNMGSDYAHRIDPDTEVITVGFDGSNSMAVADGATIVTYAWEAPGGSFVGGTAADDPGVQLEFPVGVYVVQLTVTDSNGKSNSGFRLVLADDPNDSLCVSGVQVQNISWDKQSKTARLRLLQDLPRASYPDCAHILIWEDRDPAIYGTPDPNARDHVLFSGWHQTDHASVRSLETHRQRDTILTCVDAAGRLDSLPGFPQRVEVPTEDDLAETGMNWGYMPAANMDKFMCYLLHWHSTAGAVADFYPSGTWDEYPFVLFDSGGATLFEQLARQAARIVPDYNFGADRLGSLRVEPHPFLLNVADRPAAEFTITANAWSELDLGYQRPPRVHSLRGSALLTQSEWEIDGDGEKQLLTPVFCIAPGTAPGQGGREQTLGERLAKSQQDLNDCVGHHYAQLNSRYGPITLALTLNLDPWAIDPARMALYTLVVNAASAPQRGLDFEQRRVLVSEVSIDFTYAEEATTWRARLTLESETVGLPALTEVQEPALPPGEQPTVITPPDFGLITDQELVAGIGADGHLYRTSDFQTPSGSGGPTWDQVDLSITEAIYSWVVDPFSPGYIAGSGAINGWIASETDIYRVEDVFGTPSATSVHTFATATDITQGHWRSIQASFGAFFEANNPWLLCISYYGDSAAHTGTWALRSLDGGATWETEVQVSAHYDNGPPATLPIAVYTSPKTPGLAYTCAYLDTASPALGDGFVSTDWGETWSAMSGAIVDDPSFPLPAWRVWDTILLGYDGAAYFSGRGVVSNSVSASNGGSDDGGERKLYIGPPADANRVTIKGRWVTDWSEVNPASQQMNIDPDVGGSISQSENLTHTVAGTPGGLTWQDFDLEWTFAGTNWPNNRGVLPTATTEGGADMGVRAEVTTGVGGSSQVNESVVMRVVEIELDGGAIYVPPIIGPGWLQPGEGFGGALHLPWESNDAEEIGYYGYVERWGGNSYKLIESIAGVQSDISPVESGVSYGVNAYGFSIRAYDSNRQHLAMGGVGNDAGTDKVGLWVSANAGAAWTNILAPVAATNALYGLQIAFAGDDSDALYSWGGYSDSSIAAIYYSDDFGATLDDRSGNLESSFGGVAFIGIAGGIS